MLSNKLYILLILISVFVACSPKHATKTNYGNPIGKYNIYYAKGFRVKKYPGFTQIQVVDPWDTLRVLHSYNLVPRNEVIPNVMPEGTLVRVPLKRVVTYSTIHCSTLNALNCQHIIKGVCEPQYIKLKYIQDGVANGSIENLGMASNPDVEKIVMLAPEAVFATPIAGQTYGKLSKTNIPIIETISYTESDPLGRAEWIRYYGLFTGNEKKADSLFSVTVKNYNNIKHIVSYTKEKPKVLVDLRYRNSWNMPGGRSYMANMLMDAGANYPWSRTTSTTYMSLSFESVLNEAADADIWLIKYFDSKREMTYLSLKAEYAPYSFFKAYKTHSIYGCNTSYSNYYEDLPIHPDWILKDMAFIFHSNLFRGYAPVYFTKINL